MTPIKQILAQYPSMYAAAKALGYHAQTLSRWRDANALVDADGVVWTPTNGRLDLTDTTG